MGKKAQQKRSKKQQFKPQEFSGPPRLNRRTTIALQAIAIFAILVLGIILRTSHLDILRRTPDEAVYTAQSRAIVESGLEGSRRMVREYNANPSLWIFPPPSRVGYGYILAGMMKATGLEDPSAGSRLSAFASIATLFITILIGIRFFNPFVSFIALLLLAVSPMDLTIARRCWQDSLFALFGTILIYITCEIWKHPRRLLLYIPFAAVGSYCLLIKESGILLYGLCGICILWRILFKGRAVLPVVALTLSSGLFFVAAISALGLGVGSLNNILVILSHVKEAMPTNEYAIVFQTGPWHQFFAGLWILSPLSVILAGVGIFGAWRGDRTAPVTAISFIVAAFLLVTSLTPYCQNIRYVSVVYAAFYLMAGWGLWCAVEFAKSIFKNSLLVGLIAAILVMTVAGAAALDYRTFKSLVIEKGMVDLSIKQLQDVSRKAAP